MTESTPKHPRPSYEDGEARDPRVRQMLEDADHEDQPGSLLRLLKRAAQKTPKPVKHLGS